MLSRKLTASIIQSLSSNQKKDNMKFTSLFLIIIPFFCFSQLRTVGFTDWEILQKQDPRPAVIHIYTDWCQVCKIENFKLNKNQELAELLNEKFYFIPFEAEKTTDTIIFQGKEFHYRPNGSSGIHELVLALSRNKSQPVYPLWIIVDKHQNLVDYHEGIFMPEELNRKLLEVSDL